jgi:hypothetical protein
MFNRQINQPLLVACCLILVACRYVVTKAKVVVFLQF